MALGFIARAVQAGLAKLGEASLLDGVNVGKVALERDVEVTRGDAGRSDDNYTAHADVVMIDGQYASRVGQTLVHPDGTFKLSALVEDSGYARSFIVVPA